ncbi:hypothetical protein [Acuticoccus kandeliae]|nr:hypothetical protein [Acuticoccus kandeliae]
MTGLLVLAAFAVILSGVDAIPTPRPKPARLVVTIEPMPDLTCEVRP